MSNSNVITVENLKTFHDLLPAKNGIQLQLNISQGIDIPISICYALATLSDDTIFMATNFEIKYSTDRGITWQDSNITNDIYPTLAVLSDDTIIVGSGSIHGIKYSTDRGITWQDSNITTGFCTSLAVLPDDTIIADGSKYSTDRGATWQQLDTQDYRYGLTNILTLSDGTILRAYGSSIKYSIDNGVTWQDSNITSGNYDTFAELSDNTIIVGSRNYNNGIKYSIDRGVTWQDSNITTGLCLAFAVLSDDTIIASVDGTSVKHMTISKQITVDTNPKKDDSKFITRKMLVDTTNNLVNYFKKAIESMQNDISTLQGKTYEYLGADEINTAFDE